MGAVHTEVRPVLIYDGDCAFCTRCVRVAALLDPSVDLQAWQFADLAQFGLTEQATGEAVQWVDGDSNVLSGHFAVAAVLRHSGRRPWSWLGRVIVLPVMSNVAAWTYRCVAEHRDRMPGGTPACALPPDQRPGASRRP